MLKNIKSDIQNQITFGVLALNRILERKALDDALAQDTLSEAHETLNTAVRPEHAGHSHHFHHSAIHVCR